MSKFKDIIGYDLHTSKVAFTHDGVEIAFIHDFFMIRRRVYVDGEQVFSRFSQCLGFFTDTEFNYRGNHFRLITRTRNYLSMRQDVTLWVDGHEVGRKTDRFYAALSLSKKFHAVLGPMLLGLVVGIFVGSIS